MITLQNRLVFTYTLFISLALGILTLTVNLFTGLIFTVLIKDNIAAKSAEILRVMGDQYRPLRGFDPLAIEAMGMYFVHEGYIIRVEDAGGNLVWDARSCDMQECTAVLKDISERMEKGFRVKGGMQSRRYPVIRGGSPVGTVTIETYGPFFYSETESRFLSSLNKLLILVALMLTLLSVGISLLLAQAIARPVNKAAEAARHIAQVHSQGLNLEAPGIRIPDRYRTRELAELSRSINELAEKLEAGERRQKQLTGDIAHELRTPLACLQGDMEAMIDGVYPPDKPHLESCHEEIIRLTSLVQDLNTLTVLEGEGLRGMEEGMMLHKTAFDLGALLGLTGEQFRTAAGEKGIELCLNLAESPIIADWDRLKQVFINLLSNAVKYTDRGRITLSVARAEIPGPVWEVTVADTGMGIPEKDIPHIFERFYRSDKSRNRATGGAGIGLTIAAAIVHAHGGIIRAESKTGEGADTGSVFHIWL